VASWVFNMTLRFIYIFISFIWISIGNSTVKFSDKLFLKNVPKPYFTEIENTWVDSVFNTLTLEDKIGQFFMVAAYSNQGEGEYQKIESLIRNHKIGGLIFMQGTPEAQLRLTNRYQNASKTPLLIGFDGEWGLGMRLNNVINYPKGITLGAIQNDTLIYKMGRDMAEQFKRVGVQLNFGPDADVNTNPNNPVIGFRSFGEIKENVASKAIAYTKGLQSNGVIANAKHFPGHGDASSDSHYSLPHISRSVTQLNEVELYPFQQLIGDSIMSVISGHLDVPSLDNRGYASSLSDKILIDLLRNQMGFKGLVFTDAMNMKAISKNYPNPGDLELKAFMAGNDVLLMAENVISGISKIKAATLSGKILQSEIDLRVKKILKAKYWAGLGNRKSLDSYKIEEDLNKPKYLSLKQLLYENAVTTISNLDNVLPINENQKNLVSVAIGAELGNDFQQSLLKFGAFQLYANESRSDERWYNSLLGTLDTSKTVIVSLHKLGNSPARRYNISPTTINFLTRLQKRNKVILVALGNPYSLTYFQDIKNVVCGYEDDPLAQKATAQVMFGASPSVGRLPVSIGKKYLAGTGINYDSRNILGYSMPEAVGLDSKKLEGLESYINEVIAQRIMPGCNLLVAKKGKVAYSKSFGKLSYDGNQKVSSNTIYDLASITKIASTLQAIMKLKDLGMLDLDEKAGTYLQELEGTNKENLTIRNILLHQAGLHGYIPFWENTKKGVKLDTAYYSRNKSANFPFTVETNIYGNQALKDSMWSWVIKSELISRKNKAGDYSYLYSDLGLMMLQKVVEAITNEPIDKFVNNTFYKPMGLNRIGFNINQKLNLDDFAPTENDLAFRGVQIKGTVQDQSAAMLGGVAGHAGLFATALDLAKMMQMNLNKGNYGGKQYLNEATLPYFTKDLSNRSHRALGWDKLPENRDSHYISNLVSSESYGHSGYTGTMVWVDPKYDLVFIFLSNRVYPNANNNKMNALKIRRKIQDIVYQAIDKTI
jgi:beta-N-acetylhexosaminidase